MSSIQIRLLFLFLFIFLFFLSGCSGSEAEPTAAAVPAAEEADEPAATETPPPFTLTSPAFTEGAAIAEQYTCDGENISPALDWKGVPADTASLTLIMDDPDAGSRPWVHWVLFNITPDITSLPEAVSPDEVGTPGRSSFLSPTYGGPCPPAGTHHYIFKLYALDIMLDVPPNTSKDTLLAAMEGHILAETQLTGIYER